MPDRANDPPMWPRSTVLHCAVDASQHGPVVGCCSLCGLLLCAAHVSHRGGRTGYLEGYPLYCPSCASRMPGRRHGLPRHPQRDVP